MAAILNLVEVPYLTEISSDSDEIYYIAPDFQPEISHVTKNENFSN